MIFQNRNRNVTNQYKDKTPLPEIVTNLDLIKNKNQRIMKYDIFELALNSGKCANCGGH